MTMVDDLIRLVEPPANPASRQPATAVLLLLVFLRTVVPPSLSVVTVPL